MRSYCSNKDRSTIMLKHPNKEKYVNIYIKVCIRKQTKPRFGQFIMNFTYLFNPTNLSDLI